MFNLEPDNVFRNCLDSKRGDCLYAECEVYPTMKCVFDRSKVVDDSTGCVPTESKHEHLKRMITDFIPDSLGVPHVPNLKFKNVVFASGDPWLDLPGRLYYIIDED